MTRYFQITVLMFFILSMSAPVRTVAKVYVWTDESGVRHYSNIAPPDPGRDQADGRNHPENPAGQPV